MILSHAHRFIFIKTRKTAGTSVEVFLSGHCGPDDVITPIVPPEPNHTPRNDSGLWNPFGEALANRGRGVGRIFREFAQRRRFYNHMPARRVRARVPRPVWDGYFTFTIERNPWDKALSHYHMMRYRHGGTFTLDDYFRRGTYCINYPKYTDLDGRLIVDRVLRYERLDEEMGEVCARLGIPYTGSIGVRAKGGYREDRRHYSEILTADQAAIIGRIHAKEIALHGYTF